MSDPRPAPAAPSPAAEPAPAPREFRPYIAPETALPELTVKAVVTGALFGILFGAATVYLALKAGLTVSASIPIAVLSISLGRKLLRTSILENNIIQTTGSAGESIAAGVVFTLPGFLFLSAGEGGVSVGAGYFNYFTLAALSLVGGILGVLMMIPLRRSLIVKEHGNLLYPEGAACASVLIAGDKGGDFARTAFQGVGFAFVYALLQKIFHVVAEAPAWVSSQRNKWLPSATVNGEITPEYLGVGYIIGPAIAGVLVAGGVLAWLGLIPLLSVLVPPDVIHDQLVKVGSGAAGGFDPATHAFSNLPEALYRAYIRQVGAGAVAAGGFITLLKTLPTIWLSLRDSIRSMGGGKGGASVSRTERDLSFVTVLVGSVGLVVLVVLLPQVPGDTVFNKILIGLLIIAFGFIFVTVSSRIVGIIGSSSNPISGMTIATLMATAMVFVGVGWTGRLYEPMALVVGGMVCIAAANAGATSQDLKTGFLVGATPRAQQIALFVGAIVSALVVGVTVKVLDTPTARMVAAGVTDHAIGSRFFPAPQATLMATLVKGLLSLNLDWHFVLVGVFLAVTMELCGVKSLSFAVGVYLPLSTTLPIFVGGAVKGLVDRLAARRGEKPEESELGGGSLFATGLVAGGALMGVVVALLQLSDAVSGFMRRFLDQQERLEHALGTGGYQVLGVAFFAALALFLFRVARRAGRTAA